MIDTVIFDLDGTLVDSVPDLHAAANRMLAEFDLPPVSRAQVTDFVGNGIKRLVGRCLDAAGFAGDEAARGAALASFRAHYGAAPARLTQPYAGVGAMLAALGARGIALGVCTNKPGDLARRILDDLGLGRHFAAVVGGDEGPALKPDPAPLLHCLALVGGRAATTLYVGDSEVDRATAAAAGIRFALYSGGYRKIPVADFAAAITFGSFEDLAPLVLGNGKPGPPIG